MEVKKVYIIFNKSKFTKENIVQILLEENYKYDFYFGNLNSHEFSDCYLQQADEVWCFGNCEHIEDYKMAKALAKDFWIMG